MFLKLKKSIFVVILSPFILFSDESTAFGIFNRVEEANPLICPLKESTFYCPLQGESICWENMHTFNPSAVVREGKVYLIYRAEDDSGTGIGFHTSRLGLAVSCDGINFSRSSTPIFFPDIDDEVLNEYPGGCEDPRIVETEDGTYVMTYTQWNRELAVIGIATSADLVTWKKQGYAFKDTWDRQWCKSGSIICRQEEDKLIATKIDGKYWMYFGEGNIYAAVSNDLISWTPIFDENQELVPVLEPRLGKFDSMLVESGPPAVLRDDGIHLLYNGKNSGTCGDPEIAAGAYSAGQVTFDSTNPLQMIARKDSYFLTPTKDFESFGQYQGGTVFIEGLVHFKGSWFLYYGAADSHVGVARALAN